MSIASVLPDPTESCTDTPALPEWFAAAKIAALAEFQATPEPTRKDEAWRYSDLAALDISGFGPAGEVSSEGRIISASRGLAQTSGRLIFGNNSLLHREIAALPQGVLFCPLDVAAREHTELLREFFMAQPVELGSHRFAALHRARVEAGALLYVPPGVEVALPFEVFHWAEGDMPSLFPHTLIVLGDNARATLVDTFRSADGKRAFACGVNDLHLGRGARLDYVAIQEWSEATLAFHLNSTTVGRDATATALLANFGGGYVRGESYSRLVDEGARSEMFSVSPLDGNRQVDQRTLQDHAAPNASSDLLYLNALADSARSVFSGLIKVQEGAHRTDAYQKVRNLLLSDKAEASSMPGLEILADDVRCTHGATSGEISEDELFYLAARGIPQDLASRLIINGFFQAVIGRLGDASIRSHIESIVAAKLGLPTPA